MLSAAMVDTMTMSPCPVSHVTFLALLAEDPEALTALSALVGFSLIKGRVRLAQIFQGIQHHSPARDAVRFVAMALILGSTSVTTITLNQAMDAAAHAS